MGRESKLLRLIAIECGEVEEGVAGEEVKPLNSESREVEWIVEDVEE